MAEKKRKSQAEMAAAGKKKTTKSKQTTAQSKAAKNPETKIPPRVISSVVFIFLFLLFLFMLIRPEGALTMRFINIVHGLIGRAGYLVSIPVLLYLFVIHAFSGKRPVMMRTVCMIGFVICCGCITHHAMGPEIEGRVIPQLYQGGIQNKTGGVLCGGIAELMDNWLGLYVPYIILIPAALLTLLAGINITIPSMIRAIQNRPRSQWDEEQVERPEPAEVIVNRVANKRIEYLERRQQEKEAAAKAEEETPAATKKRQDKANEIMRQIDNDVEEPVAAAGETVVAEDEPEIIPVMNQKPEVSVFDEIKESVEATIKHEKQLAPDVYDEPEETEAPAVPVVEDMPQISVPDVKKEKVTAKDAEESAKIVAEEIAKAEAAEQVEYCFPPIELLKLPSGAAADGTNEMRDNTLRLNETLASFKIDAHIINVTRGPSVTRYEVELEKGVRLSKLTTVADDIALSLGAVGVRIAAVPGRISVVGIEVPNENVTTVSLREVIDSREFNKAGSKSTFAVGKDIGGNCIVGNISKLPHMLIAGTTGSGKSVCMNSIIISLLYKASPQDVKLIMVDPKMVELGIYNEIPHLLIPVVTDPKKAAGSLQWAVTEMMRRYKAMKDAGVRDLESYNSIISKEDGGDKLPQVVVIIDELADLMLVAAKEVEESICRIAQMGRAAGIHLIIATQRPSADVITGLMKANIPSRIAFAVASAMESRIILDSQGAEKLVGKGDMLYAPIGGGKPQRVQGCFVTDAEVEAVAEYVKSNFVVNYDQDVLDEIEKKAAQTGTKSAPAEPAADELAGDELLPQAVDVVLELGMASVSKLQRRLKLGYARAARIVDEMEEMGIVGPFVGSKPREILITKEQWEQMRGGQSTQMGFDDLAEESMDQPVPDDF